MAKQRQVKRAARAPFPPHLGGNLTQWRERKRLEWASVMASLACFGRGSAYTPNYGHLCELRQLTETITRELRGRWRI
jgi:hypothetical protein